MFKNRSEIFDSNFVYFLIIVLFVAVRIIASTFVIDETLHYILNVIIQIGLMFSLPVFLYSYLRKQKLKTTFNQYGFKKVSIKSVILSFLIGILVYLITIFVSTFFSGILSFLGYEDSSSGTTTGFPLWLFFVELLFTAVLPGICEEVAHRGMLLSSYKKMGAKKSILLTGVLFGLMHLNIEQFFYATIIGCFLSALVLATDNIIPAIIIHFTNNAISTFMSFSIANNLPIAGYINGLISSIVSQGVFLGIIMLFMLVALLVILLLFLSFSLLKDLKVKQLASVADEMLKKHLRRDIMKGIESEEAEILDNENIELNSTVVGNKKIFNLIFKNGIAYKSIYQPTYKDKIFLIVSLFIGITTTICTFIWGVL